jgi:phosphatidylglycerophosphate synthase
MSSRRKLYFVTLLTFVRFPLVILFLVFALLYTRWSAPWLFAAAFVSLVTSAVTDVFDGYFARRFRVETRFGAHADPLMDKFFALSTLPLLVFVSARNAYAAPAAHAGEDRHAIFLLFLTLLILVRDQWGTFLRSVGSIYNVSSRANWSGKLRTCINFPLICAIYHFEESPWPLIDARLLHAFEAVAVTINVLSLYVYTARYWPYLRRLAEAERPGPGQSGAAGEGPRGGDAPDIEG